MGENGSVFLPEASSSFASEVDALFNFVLAVSTVFFIAVVGTMIYFVIRYRRRSHSFVPAPGKDSRLLELVSIVFPTILVLILFTWGFQVFITLSTAPPDSYEIRVRGKQWFWEFEYPNGVVTVNEMYVPLNKPVRLKMSAEDVLHSFFVPEFRVKHDVIPNRYTTVWFEATKAGEYRIYCTEYCGTQHSAMLGMVHAVPEAEFNTWLQNQDQDIPLLDLGERIFSQYACNACHAIDGTRKIGPPLNGLAGITRTLDDGSTVVADDSYIRESILDPNAKVVDGFAPGLMPAALGASLTPRQLDGLLEYIKSLD